MVLVLIVPAQAVTRTFSPVSLKPGALNEVYAWSTDEFPVFQVELTRGTQVLAASSSFFTVFIRMRAEWKVKRSGRIA